MPLRVYLLIMSAMTAVCWLIFGYIIWTVNPETTNWAGFFLFYLSLFFSIIGTTAIIGFVARFIFLRRQLIPQAVKIAFRQSFLFAGFVIVVLFFLSRGLLSWLNLAILIIGLSALEFFLLSYGRVNGAAITDTNINEDIKQQNF